MRSILAGFIAGVLLLHQLPELPPELLLWAAAAGAPVLAALARTRTRTLRLAAGCLLGLATAGLHAGWALAHRLPPRLEQQDIAVKGRVDGLPRDDGYRTVFYLVPEPGSWPGEQAPRRLRLSWYDPPQPLAAGQRWAFTVRLKRPHGLMNPGGFDYERWLFAASVDAVGYVRPAPARLLGRGAGMDGVRGAVSRRIDGLLPPGQGRAVVKALAVADRRGIDGETWRLFNDTGTGHLLAISGLHVGLAGLLGGLLAGAAWRCSARLCRRAPARLAAVAGGFVLAGGYALLAGLGLPTRRALLMAAVAAGGWLGRRHWRVADVLLLALAAVLAVDPLAPLGAGLWLSFWAVAVLLVMGSLRGAGRLRGWLGMQLGVSVALFPLTASWFGRLPLVSPLANAVAVPAVSLLVVPPVLLGLALLPIAPGPAGWVLHVAAEVVGVLMQGLAWLQARGAVWPLPHLPLWVVTGAGVGVLCLAVPGRWPGRMAAAIWLLPIVMWQPPRPAAGEARVTVADVGQGTAVVVETRTHTLVYDTGPKLGRMDAGGAALLPVLKSRGRRRLDRLIVSHADQDHAGGAATLLHALPVGEVLSGEPIPSAPGARRCRAGQSWRWDGVRFEIVYPARTGLHGNVASCVLRVVSGAGAAALLPGDLPARGEQRLLAAGRPLDSALLVAPHHGSKSSSSPAFVDAVNPREVVFSAGYRNRYGLPAPDVVRRYTAIGARPRETWRSGALTYVLGRGLQLAGRERLDHPRYYRAGTD